MLLESFNKFAGRVLSGYQATRRNQVALYPDKNLPLVY